MPTSLEADPGEIQRRFVSSPPYPKQAKTTFQDPSKSHFRKSPGWMKPFLGGLVLAVLIPLVLALVPGTRMAPSPPVGFPTNLIPESERPLDVCVIGLEANQPSYFLLPTLKKTSGMASGAFKEIQKQLYWINLELSHGRILSALPATTQLYVALPDSSAVTESLGGEKDLFLGYLEDRCHWTEGQIQARIHFFKSPVVLNWSQDIGKILGKDDKGRWVICRGSNDQESYRQAIVALCRAFPDRFAYHDLPEGISTEGGDEDLVRSPGGNLVLLAGRHRAWRYLQWSNGFSGTEPNLWPSFGQALNGKELSYAQEGFQKAFSPLAVSFVPSKLFKNPSLGSDELFHLDMLVAVVGNPGQKCALVPTYLRHPVDRISGQPLPADFVKHLQREFDEVAGQMKTLGFPVVRLPLDDHPVRSPANMLRYYDPETGHCTVLISKYPNQTGAPFPQTTQGQLLGRLGDLRQAVDDWEGAPGEGPYQAVLNSLASVWSQMDKAANETNPLTDQTRAKLEKAGMNVVAVPDFSWGAGGLHCETLH